MPKFKIALLCGGPTQERGISLNSARTVLDHLSGDQVEIRPVYFDQKKKPYLISTAQLYSNTPADFDFKLYQTAKKLNRQQLISFLKKANITFPVMHGKFGENGEIQQFLEKNKIPFIGSSSKACELAFDKASANQFLRIMGFYAVPSLLITKLTNQESVIASFFKKHNLKKAVVKPARSGSSIAVYAVLNPREAQEACFKIFCENIDDRIILEPFCQGREFTVIILQNKDNQPVALIPTEIELSGHNKEIFDYRKKYLASRQVAYHCPPRFNDKFVRQIQGQAQDLFRFFGLGDFARFDGWLLPDGKICFSDFNTVSGMEQNSFLFLQASRLGMSHRDLLTYLVKNACRRYHINFPKIKAKRLNNRKAVNVLFAGQTAEKQVSVMSGTNVWLKLKNSSKYNPEPYLLGLNNHVWRLPYALTLNHTAEEIIYNCQQAKKFQKRLINLSTKALTKLNLDKTRLNAPWFAPQKMSLKKFIKTAPYVFIALHGGAGEDGRLQKMLEAERKPFNGSGSAASLLGMNKFLTGERIKILYQDGIYVAPKQIAKIKTFLKFKTVLDFQAFWYKLTQNFKGPEIIVKPIDDGCSTGIARLYSAKDLEIYIKHTLSNFTSIPDGYLTNQHGIIEMPSRLMAEIMFEKFIITDKVTITGSRLNWEHKTGWIEITCGLLEVSKKMRAFNPSITVATGNVLTLEEKFQSGTGVNITPPPAPFIKPAVVKNAKRRIEIVAKTLGLNGYARIDAFMNIKNGELIIIEANTLPGLTPSTVIYHQALAEKPPLYPKEFLEKIIERNY